VHCIKIERWNNNARSQQSPSVLKWLTPGRGVTTTTHVDNYSTPIVTFYTSGDCRSGAKSSGPVDVNSDSLANVWVSWRNYHPYWGWVNLPS
jgi:hypothetical protein